MQAMCRRGDQQSHREKHLILPILGCKRLSLRPVPRHMWALTAIARLPVSRLRCHENIHTQSTVLCIPASLARLVPHAAASVIACAVDFASPLHLPLVCSIVTTLHNSLSSPSSPSRTCLQPPCLFARYAITKGLLQPPPTRRCDALRTRIALPTRGVAARPNHAPPAACNQRVSSGS
jgi:hypothetical protein